MWLPRAWGRAEGGGGQAGGSIGASTHVLVGGCAGRKRLGHFSECHAGQPSVVGSVLCVVGCLAASLAFTH